MRFRQALRRGGSGERAQRALGRSRSTLVKRAGGHGWWRMLGRSRSTLVKRAGGSGWPFIDGGALEHGGQSTRARAHGGCGGGVALPMLQWWAGARRALMSGAHGGCGATRQSCTVPCRLAEGGREGAQKIFVRGRQPSCGSLVRGRQPSCGSRVGALHVLRRLRARRFCESCEHSCV